jgi:diacylglycerol kinase (ATP)
MLGYKDNIITNLKLALEGTVKNMDICIINNRPFVYVAGMGKFTDVSYDTPRKLKNKIGYLAYVKEGIKAFFSKTNLYDVEYEINGEKYRGLFSFILVSSANRIAGIKGFYKDIKLDDDNFEVLMCSITRKKDIIKSLYFLTKYDISKVPGFYFYQSNNMKIRLSKPLKKEWCIDGEKLEDNGDKFNIHIDNDFKVLVPNKNIDELFIDTTIKKF